MVKSIRHTTQAHDLAQRIRQRIQKDCLADGTFFMTEAQLASEYGVSRTVTREAVSRLQGLGILEGRKRKGLLVRHPDPLRLLSSSLPSLAASPDDLRDLALLRYALEVGAIELAIRAATPAKLEALAKVTDELEQMLRADPEAPEIVELDLEFHSQILQMTDCRMLAGMQEVLVHFFDVVPRVEVTVGSTERIIWEHRELFNSIRDGDVERARAMIRMQLRTSFEAARIALPASGEE